MESSFRRRGETFLRSLSRFNSLNSESMAQEKSLKTLLAERKVDMSYGQEKRSQTWIPFDAIEDVLGSEQGQESLRTLSVDINKLRIFTSKSKRLWALLVHVDRLGWLESFRNADFDDSLFPIRRSGNWGFQSCNSKKTVTMPGKSGGDKVAMGSIKDQQWQFFVPIFGPKSSPCEFDYHCRMPFIRELQTKETNISAVTEFVIHRKHLDFRPDNQIVRDNPVTTCSEIDANAWFQCSGPWSTRLETLTLL